MSRFEENKLEEIWAYISSNQQIPVTLFNDYKTGKKLSQLMTDYFRTGSFHSLEQPSNLSSEEKSELAEFFKSKETKQKIDIDWNVGIILGNNYSHKSLHPIVDISVDGEKYEFDVEGVAATRLALAVALQTTDKYEKDE